MISLMAGPKVAPHETSTETVNVLIVEDFSLYRKGLVKALAAFKNIQVMSDVSTAEEALLIVKETPPDVVLMDLGLGGMDGISATKEIKRLAPQVRVIVLTSHEQDTEVVGAFASGANGYCLKDISPSRLSEIIAGVVDGGAWLDPAVAKVALSLFQTQGLSQFNTTASVSSSTHPDYRSMLTDREMQVLEGLVQGMTNQELADRLYVSVHTIKADVANLLQKLQVDNRVQAAALAVEARIVSYGDSV